MVIHRPNIPVLTPSLCDQALNGNVHSKVVKLPCECCLHAVPNVNEGGTWSMSSPFNTESHQLDAMLPEARARRYAQIT